MSSAREKESRQLGKIKKALQLLLVQRHRKPGVKGWELRRHLGKHYLKILEVLSSELEKFGLEIKAIYENGDREKSPDRARFVVTVKEKLIDLSKVGWRIDDIAALVVTVACIISKQGKVQRKYVEQILSEKIPKWRVGLLIDRFIRQGYIFQEKDMLYLDWRAHAEIDKKLLIKLVVEEPLD